MQEGTCKYFLNCGFYKKYDAEVNREDKITLFHQYIEVYCFGVLKHNCYRSLQREKNGTFPDDDITPTGVKYLHDA